MPQVFQWFLGLFASLGLLDPVFGTVSAADDDGGDSETSPQVDPNG